MSVCDLFNVSATVYFSSPEITLVKFLLGIYFFLLDNCCNIIFITSLSCSGLSTSDCRYEGSRLASHQKFFMWLLDVCLYITHVCSLVLYNGQWLSGLSCLFLLQKYWSMLDVVGLNPATGSYSSTFILSIQIRNFPTPLPYHMYICAVAPPW